MKFVNNRKFIDATNKSFQEFNESDLKNGIFQLEIRKMFL